MADYEGFLTAEQPWPFLRLLEFPDAWNISDAEPLAGSSSDFSTENVDFLFPDNHEASPVQNPATNLTSTGGSENEGFATQKQQQQQRRSVVPPRGGIAKRKSRPSKRATTTTTTFIAADPEHFRRMVQEVTGARYGGEGGGLVLNSEVRTELNRPGSGGGLATVDTSAIWRCAEPICSFPTLESWKAA